MINLKYQWILFILKLIEISKKDGLYQWSIYKNIKSLY